ncbi:MAG: DUF3108 domain-containing protein [Candidatus Cloacimonetes bacterium]|nr:DUF3108 domain-containing protein [Candidatus Cloacimonadota bacterium]
MDISIRFFGLKVVKVIIVDKNSSLDIHATSTSLASIASKMDNIYKIIYSDDYLPVSYTKKIRQKDYFEDRITNYSHEKEIAKRTDLLKKKKSEYKIKSTSRDFFSALFFLRDQISKKNRSNFWVDANKVIWKVNWEIIKKEKIETMFGKTNTIKVKMIFNNFNNQKKERTDMLTNNLVDEKKELIFWFTDDEKSIPIKAKFASKPFPVYWTLDNYEK